MAHRNRRDLFIRFERDCCSEWDEVGVWRVLFNPERDPPTMDVIHCSGEAFSGSMPEHLRGSSREDCVIRNNWAEEDAYLVISEVPHTRVMLWKWCSSIDNRKLATCRDPIDPTGEDGV